MHVEKLAADENAKLEDVVLNDNSCESIKKMLILEIYKHYGSENHFKTTCIMSTLPSMFLVLFKLNYLESSSFMLIFFSLFIFVFLFIISLNFGATCAKNLNVLHVLRQYYGIVDINNINIFSKEKDEKEPSRYSWSGYIPDFYQIICISMIIMQCFVAYIGWNARLQNFFVILGLTTIVIYAEYIMYNYYFCKFMRRSGKIKSYGIKSIMVYPKQSWFNDYHCEEIFNEKATSTK